MLQPLPAYVLGTRVQLGGQGNWVSTVLVFAGFPRNDGSPKDHRYHFPAPCLSHLSERRHFFLKGENRLIEKQTRFKSIRELKYPQKKS